jgi:endonuclease/exonuclease/phosphatase family metal-dependent hydrolase
VERILNFLKETCGDEPALLVGDFNLTEDDALMVWLTREGGLWDTFRTANPDQDGITWDADRNENTQWLGGLFSLPEKQRGPDYHLRAAYDRQSRRIDYVFLNSVFRKNQILESRVVLDQPVGGVHASDHYGVMSVVSLPPARERP